MSIGIALSPFALAPTANAVDGAVAIGRDIVELGLSSLWFGQGYSHDTIALAAVVGREVPGLEVGTSAVPIQARHPLLIASLAQTAQAAAHGRFSLGLGLGSAWISESYGADFVRPAARLREFLTALTSVLDTGSADFRGEMLTAVTPMSAAVAGATPRLPVLVAAMGPQALRVTGELADGTLPFLAGPRALADHIVTPLTRAAERAGRPRPRIVALVPGVVTSDIPAARRAAEEHTTFYDDIPSYARIIELSGVSRAADLVVLGDEDTIAARIQEYFDAGATDVVFTQTDLTTPEDQRRTWKLLGELSRARGSAA
ncbi:TIGR03564 family F420-dependent LLM class oxidoreductase [Nocardia terpenica]|uniref:LLM class F420-dependent oxidoreductase n=1 Tax=Nocardia terpenica TaxID=455432 RepID=A0A164MSA3_9NOCA|nr:TIGR03564 family F420-dependent LLM class oxidoreductase [Nocardia terpenica]KZM73616.1 LLM class F420-dependent oxidoreductase [Nocardia terpenica]NQE87166.1 TIGR03564 family F420-dependent LLM class oxidoreductase [Nocardia terpenica]